MMKKTAELLLICELEADDPLVLSLVSQCIEAGVDFEADAQQQLPRTLPVDLTGYRAILLDPPAFERIMQDTENRTRLEAYVRQGGFVRGMDRPLTGGDAGLNVSLLTDMISSHVVHDVILHAGLTTDFNRADGIRPIADDAQVFAEMKAFVLQRIDRGSQWDEFTLHFWKAGKALADAGHDDVRDALLAAIRRAVDTLPDPTHGDTIGAFSLVPWLVEQTRETALLDQVCAVVDRMLERRPREQGILVASGYMDDPLGLASGHTLMPVMVNSIIRRNVVWTESLHFYGAALTALGKATENHRYIHEVELMVDHLVKHHLRDDGLLAHCSSLTHPVAIAWGRGQTHALYGLLYILEELQPTDPLFETVRALLERIARALLTYQDQQTGLWRNVIDQPHARLESTASCALVTVLARAIHERWLSGDEFGQATQHAWHGLKRMYWRGGLCAGCRGTSGAIDMSYYLARPHGWSMVPQLAIAAELMRNIAS